jgi:predicted Rossmann-fold nucleotide-binding protein
MHPQPLAYTDAEFLESDDARPIRILAEYLEPRRRFKAQNIQDTVVFFGSARIHSREHAEQALERLERRFGTREGAPEDPHLLRGRKAVEWSRYYEDARTLARMLTEWSQGLDAPHHRLHFEFHYFFMRKFWFAYLAKALVVFPGGFGTLDEMFEILTLMQTEKLEKQIQIILYGTDYWEQILRVEPMSEWGAISPADIHLLTPANTPEQAFELLKAHLTEHHLTPPVAQEMRAPGIAKTRS